MISTNICGLCCFVITNMWLVHVYIYGESHATSSSVLVVTLSSYFTDVSVLWIMMRKCLNTSMAFVLAALLSLRKKNTIHQVTTMLSVGARVIIKVLGHQYWWLSGSLTVTWWIVAFCAVYNIMLRQLAKRSYWWHLLEQASWKSCVQYWDSSSMLSNTFHFLSVNSLSLYQSSTVLIKPCHSMYIKCIHGFVCELALNSCKLQMEQRTGITFTEPEARLHTVAILALLYSPS